MLEATLRKGFEDVLENLMGTCLWNMKKVDIKLRKEAFVVEDDNVLEECLRAIFEK